MLIKVVHDFLDEFEDLKLSDNNKIEELNEYFTDFLKVFLVIKVIESLL